MVEDLYISQGAVRNMNRYSQGSLYSETALPLPDRPKGLNHTKNNSFSSSSSRNLSLDSSTPSKIPKPTIRHLVFPNNSKGPIDKQNVDLSSQSRLYNDRNMNSHFSSQINPKTNTIPLGTPVETTKEKLSGILRFVGFTKFKEGVWAGIELYEEGKGKNDGSVNGERYFSCAPSTGIFVNYLAVQPIKNPGYFIESYDTSEETIISRKNTNLMTEKLKDNSLTSQIKPVNTSIIKSRFSKTQPPSKTTISSKPSKVASKSLLRNKSSRSSVSASQNIVNSEPVSIDKPFEALLKISATEFQDPADIEDILNLPNNTPSIVIKNLLSQLTSTRKENDLLRIRINKKRARIEATRVLKTEFIDKARQEIFSRRLSQNGGKHDEFKSKEFLDKEEKIREISLQLAQNENEIEALKVRVYEIPLFNESTGSAFDFNSSHELQKTQLDLQDLQAQLLIKERLLSDLKNEIDSFGLLIQSYSNQRDNSTVKSRLNEIMTELESLKRSSLNEATSLRAEIDQLHFELQKYSEASSADLKADFDIKYHQVLECLDVAKKTNEKNELIIKGLEKSNDIQMTENKNEIQVLISKLETLENENEELKKELLFVTSIPSDNSELKNELAKSQETIENLNQDIDELHQYIDEITQNPEENDDNVISTTEFEELKNEKDNYLASLESLQKEKSDLLIQIQALKSALFKLEESQFQENIKPEHLDSDKMVLADPNTAKLEDRIRQLEDEILVAKTLNEKINDGTLTQDDIHVNLIQSLKARDETILKLDADLKEADNFIQELIKENEDLVVDNKSFEEDNWRLDDMYNEVTKELELKTKETNEYKDKVGLLKEALEAAAQTSDSARKMNDLMLKVDEIEAYFNSEIDTLLKDLTEFDEDLKAAGKREEELLSEIKTLKKKLSSPYSNENYDSYFDEEIDEEALKAFDLEDKAICHLCLGDHDPSVCPDPMAFEQDELENLGLENGLDNVAYDVPFLDENVCSDCQEPGHTFENCPNSAEVY